MEKESRRKGSYSNPFRSLEMIWSVLRRRASRTRPVSLAELSAALESRGDGPSPSTVRRCLPQEAALLSHLFPGTLAEQDRVSVTGFYWAADGFHVILENAEGEPLRQGELTAVFTQEPGTEAPSYSALDKMLKQGVPEDLESFPFRLRCMVQDTEGSRKFIPYDKWEEAHPAGKKAKRYYYLASPLTNGEWRIFSDLVQVYPYLSERQTRKFMAVLRRLAPEGSIPAVSRYAYKAKRGMDTQFKWIARLDKAVREKRKVLVHYGEYRLEKGEQGWRPVLRQREKHGELEMEPYALLWSNGYYYLVAKHRGMMNLRADRILSVELLDETFEPEPDFDPAEYRDRCPVMYPGQAQFVHLRCRTTAVNLLLDFFGDKPRYATPREDGTVEVTMSIAPAGVKLFALQYASQVEVLEPKELRDSIRDTLREALERYEQA